METLRERDRHPGAAHGGGGAAGAPGAPETMAFLLVPDFTHLAFSCAIEPLRIANLVAGRELYRWSLLAEGGGEARSSNGLATRVDGGLDAGPGGGPGGAVGASDPLLARDARLFVVAGLGVERRVTPATLAFLRRERSRGRRLGAICSGAFILAAAGLLDGEEAAIHWGYHDLMAERFPAVRLCRSVFVAGPRLTTASGGTAAADMMLHLIGQAHGEALAVEVADQMVYNAVREGSALQRVSVQARHGSRNPHVARAVGIFSERLEHVARPCEVAAELGISTRQLERLFRRHLGATPKGYATELRLQRARNLIVQTDQSVAEIAMASGFSSTTHFARAFRVRFGVSPVNHRAKLR